MLESHAVGLRPRSCQIMFKVRGFNKFSKYKVFEFKNIVDILAYVVLLMEFDGICHGR